MPEIIERAVWRKKPFTENKTELKDTVIWLSYSKYVKDQNIEFPYFLTTNINDFCNISDKTAKVFEVHDDLKIDCDHFKVFKYSKDFISEVIEKIEAENKSRYKEVAKEKVNVDFVTEVVYSKSSEVEDDVRQNIEKYDISQLFKIDYFFNGYIEAKVTNWGSKCNDIEIDILDDCCIISGYQELDVEIEGFEYIFDSNYAEDNHKFFGSMHILVKAYFTFTLDTDFEVQDFAIDRIAF